jgi:hypothetical protein
MTAITKEILTPIDYIESTEIEVEDATTALTHVVSPTTYWEEMGKSVLVFLKQDCTSVVTSYAFDKDELLKVAHRVTEYELTHHHMFSIRNLNTGKPMRIVFGSLTASNMHEKDKFIEMLKSPTVLIQTAAYSDGCRYPIHFFTH